jgi:4-alpha-glucanotransferase
MPSQLLVGSHTLKQWVLCGVLYRTRPHCHSAAGQLWGSPLYKWPEHKREKFEWWCKRMGRALELYDETRIDHFRGFAGR